MSDNTFDRHKPDVERPDASTKPRFNAAAVTIRGWQSHTVKHSKTGRGVYNHFSLWVPSNTQRYSSDIAVVAVEVFEALSSEEAQRLALRLANECQIGVTMERTTAVGDAAYVGPGGVPVVFVRSDLAVCVMQAESAQIPALEVARAIDEHIAQLAYPSTPSQST